MKIKKHFDYGSNYKRSKQNLDVYYNRPNVFNHVAKLLNAKDYGYVAHIAFSWRSFMIITTISKAENVLNMRLFTSIHCDEAKKDELNLYISKANANNKGFTISMSNGEIILETHSFFYDCPVSTKCIGQLECNLIMNTTLFLVDFWDFSVSDKAPKSNPEFSLLDLLLSLQQNRFDDEEDEEDVGINYVSKMKRENTDVDVDSIFENILKNFNNDDDDS